MPGSPGGCSRSGDSPRSPVCPDAPMRSTWQSRSGVEPASRLPRRGRKKGASSGRPSRRTHEPSGSRGTGASTRCSRSGRAASPGTSRAAENGWAHPGPRRTFSTSGRISPALARVTRAECGVTGAWGSGGSLASCPDRPSRHGRSPETVPGEDRLEIAEAGPDRTSTNGRQRSDAGPRGACAPTPASERTAGL